MTKAFHFLEFFAGGGMARAGLGFGWQCLLANDIDPKKAEAYVKNWGGENFELGDVHELDPTLLRGKPNLAWASFPCQDLSLAGNQAGLNGRRSGAFWGFWKYIDALRDQGRHPEIVVLENVYGAVTSNGGQDFKVLLDTLRDGGYRAGALVIDALYFVPQSRPRLFVIAVKEGISIPSKLHMDRPFPLWTPTGLSTALEGLDFLDRPDWISWRLPLPRKRTQVFADVVDENPIGVRWHSSEATEQLLAMMSPINRRKVEKAQLAGRKMVGTVYKRTRQGRDGVRRQQAEIRFDDVAGCLRTPGGGSSRQIIVIVEGRKIRSRLISPRETARLMGLSEDYELPENYNDAYHLTGDGVVVPVVSHIEQYLLQPLLEANSASELKAA